jgi:hypothetical protein
LFQLLCLIISSAPCAPRALRSPLFTSNGPTCQPEQDAYASPCHPAAHGP